MSITLRVSTNNVAKTVESSYDVLTGDESVERVVGQVFREGRNWFARLEGTRQAVSAPLRTRKEAVKALMSYDLRRADAFEKVGLSTCPATDKTCHTPEHCSSHGCVNTPDPDAEQAPVGGTTTSEVASVAATMPATMPAPKVDAPSANWLRNILSKVGLAR